MDYTSQKFEVTNLFCDVPGLLDLFYNPCTVSGDNSVSFPIIALSLCGNSVDCEGWFQSSYHFLLCNSDSLLEVLELIKQTAVNSTSWVMFRARNVSNFNLVTILHQTQHLEYIFIHWGTTGNRFRPVIGSSSGQLEATYLYTKRPCTSWGPIQFTFVYIGQV
jgi:hypothetical protein